MSRGPRLSRRARRGPWLGWVAAPGALLAAWAFAQASPGPSSDPPGCRAGEGRAAAGPDGGGTALVPVRTVRGKPTWIEVPRIGVSAPVGQLGLTDAQTLEVPKRYDDAGWWSGGPVPGERGAAVIAGHTDSRTAPAVFHRLDQLEAGDEIRVMRADGSAVRFVVDRVQETPKGDFPTRAVYGGTECAELRLIACSGAWNESRGHYEDNRIVFARRA